MTLAFVLSCVVAAHTQFAVLGHTVPRATVVLNLLAEGDSITADPPHGLSSGQSWAKNLLGYINSASTVNDTAVASSTLTGSAPSIAARGTTDDALLGASPNVFVVMGGINDLCENADGSDNTAATTKSRYQTLINARSASGWRVYLSTILPVGPTEQNFCNSTYGIAQSDLVTRINAVNSWILAGTPSNVSGFADPASNANLSDPTNSTYYQSDEIHPTAAGQLVIASVIGPVLGAIH